MNNQQETYNELSGYTLSHGDSTFIHQHIVDAFAAQTADKDTKPIRLIFALAGLYLHVEKQFTGRQVQLAHMKMGQKKQAWPALTLPAKRGTITCADVLSKPAGPERNEMIHQWCKSVWDAYSEHRQVIMNLLSENKII